MLGAKCLNSGDSSFIWRFAYLLVRGESFVCVFGTGSSKFSRLALNLLDSLGWPHACQLPSLASGVLHYSCVLLIAFVFIEYLLENVGW